MQFFQISHKHYEDHVKRHVYKYAPVILFISLIEEINQI